jgi:hypothetical protein
LAHGKRGRASLALVYHRPINSNILLKNLIHKVVLLGHSVSSIPCPRKLGPIYGLFFECASPEEARSRLKSEVFITQVEVAVG